MRPLFAALLVAFALASCAKGPRSGGVGSFTRIRFEVTMAEAIDPNYVYAVAIRPLYTTSDPTDSLGPVPVVTTGSTNGIVAGRPTRLVEYVPASSTRYQVLKFFNPPSDSNDPDPGFPSSTDDLFTNGLDPSTGDPTKLGFDVTLRDLADSDDQAREIVAIQFNILTASKTVLNSGDLSRAFDALGDQRSLGTTTFNAYRKVIVTTSGLYTNIAAEGGQPAAIPEGTSDVANASNGNFPNIDIKTYSVQVFVQ